MIASNQTTHTSLTMIDANENGYCGLDQVPTRQEWDPQKVYALIVALPSFVWMNLTPLVRVLRSS